MGWGIAALVGKGTLRVPGGRRLSWLRFAAGGSSAAWSPAGCDDRRLAPDAELRHAVGQPVHDAAAVDGVPPADAADPAVRVGDADEWAHGWASSSGNGGWSGNGCHQAGNITQPSRPTQLPGIRLNLGSAQLTISMAS